MCHEGKLSRICANIDKTFRSLSRLCECSLPNICISYRNLTFPKSTGTAATKYAARLTDVSNIQRSK
uniref:Uncharacterized protein n=1 Tax=Ixodes ricinus TaxID=34613 RepID=A0A6B0TSI5_IXORI